MITAGGSEITTEENWGRRKLAYEVKKNLKGVYLFFNYIGPAGLVRSEGAPPVERLVRVPPILRRDDRLLALQRDLVFFDGPGGTQAPG